MTNGPMVRRPTKLSAPTEEVATNANGPGPKSPRILRRRNAKATTATATNGTPTGISTLMPFSCTKVSDGEVIMYSCQVIDTTEVVLPEAENDHANTTSPALQSAASVNDATVTRSRRGTTRPGFI